MKKKAPRKTRPEGVTSFRKRSKANRKGRRKPASPARWLWFGILAAGIFGGLVALAYAALASTYDLARVSAIPERSAVYDCRGDFYSRLTGEDRLVVGYDQIAPRFFDALLAREDTRFYRHPGVDLRGIARAVVRNVMRGGVREGGSTLTQQLALNTFLGGRHDRSLHRKLLEAFLAIRIEENFSKQQIIGHYANRIYFGSGVYGVETASRLYFGKPARTLTLGESATLVAVIRSPNRISPRNDLRRATRERNAVLRRMLSLGMITEAEAGAAMRETLSVAEARPMRAQQNYALDAVRMELDLILDEKHWDEGGLRVFTSIDPILQRAGEEALERQLSQWERQPGYPHPRRVPGETPDPAGSRYLQGALVAVDHGSGGIRAVVGGRSFAESRFNRAWTSRRQIGSVFKPFVYAAAFERGMKPAEKISDGPLRAGEIKSAKGWHPVNADGKSMGMLPAGDGLVFSRNLVTVRVGNRAGIEAVRRIGRLAGLPEVPADPAVFLGAVESNPREIAQAFSIFPNGGIRMQTYLIDRIQDGEGRIIYQSPRTTVRVVGEKSARMVHGLLREAMERGTGKGRYTLEGGAGKTGTTDGFRDAWFAGYGGGLTCAVWVGFDDPKPIAPDAYGASVALPAWSDFMIRAGVRPVRRATPVEGEKRSLMDSVRHLFQR